jgi:hypothetical protein
MVVDSRVGEVLVSTRGLDELEVYADGRPAEAARAIVDGVHTVARPPGLDLEVVGRRAGVVRQRRRIAG